MAGRVRHPIPPSYWDEASERWGREVFGRTGAHQFQYFEADLLISKVLSREMTVLEIGCGTGDSTMMHLREVRRLVATDVSRGMIAKARRRLSRNDHRARLRFVQASLEYLPFQDHSFDAVISRGVALSYVRDAGKALREIRRVLVPGGCVAIDAMNETTTWKRSSDGRPLLRTVRVIDHEPAYIEQFNEGCLQVRAVHYLCPGSRLARLAVSGKPPPTFSARPPGLAIQTRRVVRLEARYFSALTLRTLARQAGLSVTDVVPLGQFYRALTCGDRRLQRFTERHRRTLSRLSVELRHHFRVESGSHLMLMGIA